MIDERGFINGRQGMPTQARLNMRKPDGSLSEDSLQGYYGSVGYIWPGDHFRKGNRDCRIKPKPKQLRQVKTSESR